MLQWDRWSRVPATGPLTRSRLRLARVSGRSCSFAEEQHMSTLTTEDSSPVKVAQVFADFRHGMPDSGTVFVGT